MDKMLLGHRIREVRGDAGLAREEFAGKMGVTPATVGRYEKGERTPDADFLYQLVTVFGCNPEWLLTGEGPMKRGEEGKFEGGGIQGGSKINKSILKASIRLIDKALSGGSFTEDQRLDYIANCYDILYEEYIRTNTIVEDSEKLLLTLIQK